MTGHILKFMQEVGIPITVALGVGWFLFIILKFILAQVRDQIEGIANSLLSLENKCDVMNNDIVKIDALFSLNPILVKNCRIQSNPVYLKTGRIEDNKTVVKGASLCE